MLNRGLTALYAAIEAAIIAGIGIAVPLLPLALVWMAHLGFDPDWTAVWRAAVDAYLLGHGVDVTFVIDPDVAAALGIAGAGEPIRVTMALLGPALVTVLLTARLGRRIHEAGHPVIGATAALAATALASGLATWSALHPAARPSLWQGALLPAIAAAVGIGIGMLRSGGIAPAVSRLTASWPDAVRAPVATGLRAGAAAVAIVALASSIAVAALIAASFAEGIRLYEALHTGLVGGIALTAAQLALLPNLVIWAAAWFAGPGFAIGAGSSVSPLGTALGPVPAIPVLGAIPTGDPGLGYAGLLVPVVAGFLAGFAVRRRLGATGPAGIVLAAASAGAAAGLVLGGLAWASGGAAGPGRLAVVGPDPVGVGLAVAAEVGVAAALGLAAGRSRAATRGRGRSRALR